MQLCPFLAPVLSLPSTLPSGLVIPSATLSNPTFTGVSTFDNGTEAAPGLVTDLDSDSGFGSTVAGRMFYSGNGAGVIQFQTGAVAVNANAGFGWASGSPVSTAFDTVMSRVGAQSIMFAGAASTSGGLATSRVQGNKSVASIANNTATDILTVTVPNAAHSASLKVKVTGSMGAGGAIGANEASATNTYDIIITRTAGVATVAAISSAYGAAASNVAGAGTITAVATITAMSGAVGATQTFTVQVTIARSGGSSTNHTCLVYYELMNANATGVTVS